MGEILVGVNRSTPSRAALEWSVERAHSTGMELRIVHVIDRNAGPTPDSLTDELLDEAWRLVHSEVDIARAIAPSVEVSGDVLVGAPADMLAAASEQADLVVVGTHKTGFVHGKVYGSRFLGLAGGATFACAFIPDGSGRRRAGVVAGIEDSDIGREVIRFAAQEASRLAEELLLVCSVDSPDAGSSNTHRPQAIALEVYARQLSWATVIAREFHPELRVRGRNVAQATAEALVEAAANAALLVIGHGSAHSGQPVMVGAVALNVLLNISSPVIVL